MVPKGDGPERNVQDDGRVLAPAPLVHLGQLLLHGSRRAVFQGVARCLNIVVRALANIESAEET